MTSQETFLVHLMRHEADLKAFIGSLVRDRDAREDVLHEVVLAMWAQFDQYDPARSFGAWARGIAARKVLQRRHQHACFPAVFTPEAMSILVALPSMAIIKVDVSLSQIYKDSGAILIARVASVDVGKNLARLDQTVALAELSKHLVRQDRTMGLHLDAGKSLGGR